MLLASLGSLNQPRLAKTEIAAAGGIGGGPAEDDMVDEVDVDVVADAPPADTRPASAPRRRPVGRSAPRRGA